MYNAVYLLNMLGKYNLKQLILNLTNSISILLIPHCDMLNNNVIFLSGKRLAYTIVVITKNKNNNNNNNNTNLHEFQGKR